MKIRNPFLNRLKNQAAFRFRRPNKIGVLEGKENLEVANKVLLAPDVALKLCNIRVGVVRERGEYAYHPKFVRFLKNNRIPYDFLDIQASSWMQETKNFDVLLWKTDSSPWAQEEATEKIYFLERCLGKAVYPSFAEIMFYENKVFQYYRLKHEGFPVIKTYVSFDYDEASALIESLAYPIVSKIRTGSASEGVSLLKNRNEAKRIVERVFRDGKPTYWPHLNQKNYILFQDFVENNGFDVRIMTVDENHILGYFRKVPRNDFRASGRNLIVKKELPKEAAKIALEVVKKLGFTNLSVDLLQSVRDARFYIIEASIFNKIDTLEDFKVDEVPVTYRYMYETDQLVMERGIYWPQELYLKKFMENYAAAL